MVCRLRFLAQLNGSSLFVTVLAAFKVLLAKYSSRDDLVVGTPSSGRHRPELQGSTIGCFVNLTALRTSLAGKVFWMHNAIHRPCEALRPSSRISVTGSSSEPLVLSASVNTDLEHTKLVLQQTRLLSYSTQSHKVLNPANRRCNGNLPDALAFHFIPLFCQEHQSLMHACIKSSSC